MDLKVGDAAPDFDLPASGGARVSLKALKGRKIVLYFYPKDDTSGCTKEAIGFSAEKASFEAAGATIIGVSKDSVASHDKFIKKHDLSIELASDDEGAACAAYGVWVEKSMYGKKYMGIERATFLIDAKGKIAQVCARSRSQDMSRPCSKKPNHDLQKFTEYKQLEPSLAIHSIEWQCGIEMALRAGSWLMAPRGRHPQPEFGFRGVCRGLLNPAPDLLVAKPMVRFAVVGGAS